MSTFSYYGVIGVEFSHQPKHENSISHYLIITVDSEGKYPTPAALVSKADALKLFPTTMWTLKWNYSTSSWKNGSLVGVVDVGGIKHLRSNPDQTPTDNLTQLLDVSDFQVCDLSVSVLRK